MNGKESKPKEGPRLFLVLNGEEIEEIKIKNTEDKLTDIVSINIKGIFEIETKNTKKSIKVKDIKSLFRIYEFLKNENFSVTKNNNEEIRIQKNKEKRVNN